MNSISAYILPIIVVTIIIYGQFKGVQVFDCFLDGAKEGFTNFKRLLPALVALVTAVAMLKGSGALDVLVWLVMPISRLTGIPKEVIPMTMLSPISGSGSISMYESILASCGPDSFAGRVASVIAGSTETTFYAITVYYGSVGVTKTRHTVPSALCADFTSFIISVWAIKLLGF